MGCHSLLKVMAASTGTDRPSVREIFTSMQYGPAPEAASVAQAWLDSQKRSFGHFIGGKWIKPDGRQTYATKNPATVLPQHEDLLSLINKLLRSWTQPLQYLSMGAPNNMVKKVKEAEEHTRILQGGIDRISGRMLIDLEDVYPQWFGPIDVTVPQGDSYMFPVYHLLHCFRRDSHKIDSYLKILRCRLILANC